MNRLIVAEQRDKRLWEIAQRLPIPELTQEEKSCCRKVAEKGKTERLASIRHWKSMAVCHMRPPACIDEMVDQANHLHPERPCTWEDFIRDEDRMKAARWMAMVMAVKRNELGISAPQPSSRF